MVRSIAGLRAVPLTPPIVRTVSLFARQDASFSAAASAMAEMIKDSF
jgi:hypothetical protein